MAPDASVDTGTPPASSADATDEDASAPPILDDGACSTFGGYHDAEAGAPPDADPGCWYTLPCGFGDGAVQIADCLVFVGSPDAAGDASALYCSLREGDGCQGSVYTPGPNGHLTIDCNDCFGGGGRRPVGLARARPRRARTPLGAYFARMAHDEAASVHAFDRMRAELVALGAPRSLVRAADRSARDEGRHARVMAALARAHGAEPAPARVRRARRRGLEAIARENAAEGCIRETWGALVLALQAARAYDPALRATFARVAADEARHAALSWALARFAEGRLGPAGRRRVAAARRRALGSLRRALARSATRPFDRHLGRPTPREALAMLDALSESMVRDAVVTTSA
jgi:hypothetical protein